MKRLISLTVLILFLSGCVFTKVVTVPMRVTGAVVSVIPVVGDGVNNVLDTSADVIDAIPI
jgi:PBP1b-binding outer membrane lipoprotein LpoB